MKICIYLHNVQSYFFNLSIQIFRDEETGKFNILVVGYFFTMLAPTAPLSLQFRNYQHHHSHRSNFQTFKSNRNSAKISFFRKIQNVLYNKRITLFKSCSLSCEIPLLSRYSLFVNRETAMLSTFLTIPLFKTWEISISNINICDVSHTCHMSISIHIHYHQQKAIL